MLDKKILEFPETSLPCQASFCWSNLKGNQVSLFLTSQTLVKLLCLKCLDWKPGWWMSNWKAKNQKPPKQVVPPDLAKQYNCDVALSLRPQATTKHSGFPVRMDNAVPIVPQAPAAQPLQIQSGVLTQVRVRAAWT